MKSSGHAAEAESTPLDVRRWRPHRHRLGLTDDPRAQVYVELILAFVLAFLGAYLDSPGFKSIHATADDNVKCVAPPTASVCRRWLPTRPLPRLLPRRTMDMFMENREFAVFNHRGPQLRQRLAGGQAAQ